MFYKGSYFYFSGKLNQMAKFHTLTIKDIRKETADCVSISFQIPAALQQEYTYIQGQYVTLKLRVDGEEIRRSYSLCSSPVADTELRIAAKKVFQGKGSSYLNDIVKVGDQIEVMTPMGSFYCELAATNKRNFVLFAGGSGITPMYSIIKTVLKQEPKSNITLFYANQTEAASIFQEGLDNLAAQHPQLKVIAILDRPVASIPELQQGIMTTEKVAALIENYIGLHEDNEYFICGPAPMMNNVEETLLSLDIQKNKIHLEYFTAVLEAVNNAIAAEENNTAISAKVTIILDGNETTIDINSKGNSILDAAIEADLDVPFACKGAVCCTCRAKLLEGKVIMDANFALTEEEVADGYILTCQSHPITEKVVIDYDV